MAGLVSRISRLKPERSVLFVCDIQERFRPLIFEAETMIEKSKFMCNAADALKIPIVVTEQYPRAFGHTITDLPLPEGLQIFEKKNFSMMTEEVTSHFEGLSSAGESRDQVIMVGIEAHVCIQQTVLDLLDMGKEVHLVCDAISSQRPHDRSVALDRMKASGAVLGTLESVTFDLMRSAAHPQFKTISGLLKEHNTVENNFAQRHSP
jgi:nicotinamidase-related amidase